MIHFQNNYFVNKITVNLSTITIIQQNNLYFTQRI